MAITVDVEGDCVVGAKRLKWGTFTFDNSYDASGDPIDYSDLEFELTLDHLEVSSPAGFVLSPVKTDETHWHVWGFFADYDAGADGALIEVSAATLNTVVARFFAVGQ